MTQYLVAIHHPDDFDSSTETEATVRAIDQLNEEMAAAASWSSLAASRRFAMRGLCGPNRMARFWSLTARISRPRSTSAGSGCWNAPLWTTRWRGDAKPPGPVGRQSESARLGYHHRNQLSGSDNTAGIHRSDHFLTPKKWCVATASFEVHSKLTRSNGPAWPALRRITMRKKKFSAIAIMSFVLLVLLAKAYPAIAQDVKTAYPSMAPLDQYLMTDQAAEIALARSAAPGVHLARRRRPGSWTSRFRDGGEGQKRFRVSIVERSWTSAPDAEFGIRRCAPRYITTSPAALSYLHATSNGPN